VSRDGISEGRLRANLERHVVVATIDEKFAQAVKNVGALRKTNRSVVIDVKYLFDEITSVHSLFEFAGWLESRYTPLNGTDAQGNVRIFYLTWKDLRKFTWRFLWKDRVAIVFRFDAGWEHINSFSVGLQWMLG
jgi:hypothetical protein